MQRSHDHLRGRNFFAVNIHVADGNAAAVVNHGDGVVDMDGDVHAIGIAGQRFVHGVVYHLVDQVMQAQLARRADRDGPAKRDASRTDLNAFDALLEFTL